MEHPAPAADRPPPLPVPDHGPRPRLLDQQHSRTRWHCPPAAGLAPIFDGSRSTHLAPSMNWIAHTSDSLGIIGF